MIKIDKKRIIIYLAVIGLLIFLYLLGVLKPIEYIITKTLNPALKEAHKFSTNIRSEYNSQTDKRDFQEKIKRLQSEINELIIENAKFERLEEENQMLRENLRFLSKNDYKYIISNVISRGDITDIAGRTETITIDKGLRDGVYNGLSVISSKGIVVGKVYETKSQTAKVYLSNSSKCKLAATALNDDKTSGVTEGELGLTIKMGLIPQAKEINAGDIIVTSGLEKDIPRGLVIGKVKEVNKENNELWQEATIEPMIDPDEIIIVSVLLL